MWWRFLTFCVLVCFVLFVVVSCIHGRPVIHLLFHRCCEEDIENDHVIFENFGNNFLRERLVGADIVEIVNDTMNELEKLDETIRGKINVHDPGSRDVVFNYPSDGANDIEDTSLYSDEIFYENNSKNDYPDDIEYRTDKNESVSEIKGRRLKSKEDLFDLEVKGLPDIDNKKVSVNVILKEDNINLVTEKTITRTPIINETDIVTENVRVKL